MRYKNIQASFACAIAAVVLSSCASRPPVAPSRPTAEVVESLRIDGIKPPHGTSAGWTQKTKAKVAGARVLSVASALLGGGQFNVPTGPRNAMPAESYTDLAANPTVFGPDEMLGFDDPAAAMAEALSRQLKANGIAVNEEGATRRHRALRFGRVHFSVEQAERRWT